MVFSQLWSLAMILQQLTSAIKNQLKHAHIDVRISKHKSRLLQTTNYPERHVQFYSDYHQQSGSKMYSQSHCGFLPQTPHWGAMRISSGQ